MIRRLFTRRPETFPPYTADTDAGPTLDHLGAEFHRWGRRMLTLMALLGVFGTAGSFSGWKLFGPSAQIDSLRASITQVKVVSAADISQIRDSGVATSRRVDDVERVIQTNLYISCELLRRSQPHAIAPKECSDEAQRARRDR